LSFLDQLQPAAARSRRNYRRPVLILAARAAAKRLITYRIAYLIEHKGVMPESILAMTFTHKRRC